MSFRRFGPAITTLAGTVVMVSALQAAAPQFAQSPTPFALGVRVAPR